MKDWLEKEEERKKLAKVGRRVVAGARVTWVSRKVEGKVGVEVEEGGGDVEEMKKVDKGKGKEIAPSPSQSLDPSTPIQSTDLPPSPIPSTYARNYVILAQIPGGQKAELRTLFGDQGEWTNMAHIPTRNRPYSELGDLPPGQASSDRDRIHLQARFETEYDFRFAQQIVV